MFGSRTARLAQLLALTLAILVLAAGMAVADDLKTDGDTLSGGLNLSISDCSVLPKTFTGSAKITAGSSNHFANGATVTITTTPDAAAAAEGVTATGGSITLPNPWTSTSPDQTRSITVTVPAGVDNGTYKITSQASGNKSGGGTVTLSDFYNVQINCSSADSAAPTNASITINDGLDWTNSAAGAVTVDLLANDDVGVASYRLATTQAGLSSATSVAVSPAQASWSAPNVPFTLSGAEGTSTVWLRACDATGNCSDASDTIGWDFTAPTSASVTIDDGATWTNDADGDVSLDVAANDNIGVTSYRLAESSGDLGSATAVSVTSTAAFSANDVAFQLSGSESAAKPVWFRACDAAGNCSSTSDTIGWDHTAPANASIVIDDGAAWTTDPEGDVTLDLSATDGLGVVSYRLAETQSGLTSATPVVVSSAASFSATDVAFQLSGSEGTSKAVWLRVCDAAGNCADASDTIGWDHTATTNAAIQIDDGAVWTNDADGDVTVDISGDDNVGIVSYRLAESQAGLSSATAHAVSPAEASFSRTDVAFQLSGSEAAAKDVWLRVCDGAGNCVDVSDSIGWDHTAPSVAYESATTSPNGNGWYKHDVTANFRATDNLSGFAPSSALTKDATATTSGEGANVTVGSPTFTDLAGNAAVAGAATSASYKIDKHAPTVDYTNAPEANGQHGWYISDVVATFTATDGLSGFAPSGASTTTGTSTTSGEGTAITVGSPAFTDLAGNTASEGTATSEPYMIDMTKPTVAYTSASGTAGTNGWYRSDVVATFTATDNLSGFDAAATLTKTGSSSTSGEGVGLTASSPAFTDWAGNTTAAGNKLSDPFNVDKTAPSVAYTSASGTAGTNGWYRSDVVATFTATDNLSGFDAAATLTKTGSSSTSGEGVGLTASSPAFTDWAGNTTAAGNKLSDPFNVDKTAPSVAYTSASGTAGTNGWYRSDVVATFTATDTVSGFDASATQTTTGTSTTSGEGPAVTVGSPAFTDWAGNTTAAGDQSSPAYKIDKTAPYNISWTGGPADGGVYYFGSVPGAPSPCTASDDVSQLASCALTGYDTGAGTHSIVGTATDNAGNQATRSITYTVLAWNLNGFYAPVDTPRKDSATVIWNTVKGGATVPLKWEMFTDVEVTDPAAITGIYQTPVTCSTGTADAVEITSTGGTTSPRYDWTAGQFIYNWQTPKKAGACYQVTMEAGGTSITALFKLK